MINLKGIYTVRDTKKPYYWDIVFEWEDEFAKVLDIPLIHVGKKYDKIYQPSNIKKILNRLNYYQLKDKYSSSCESYYLAFQIGVPGIYSFHCGANVIPLIIDFWKGEDLKRFQDIFSISKVVLVTSREVYNYLKEVGVKVNLQHISLSLPDKYYLDVINAEKDIDLIQIGRQNNTLNSYIKRFLIEFPSINYVYTEKKENEVVNISTKFGPLSTSSDRKSFIKLLQRSRINLLSAPGLDDDIERTGGFSPVTPRFLESAACGCHMIGIYPENDDFKYYGIAKICKKVHSYEAFRNTVLENLGTDNQPNYHDFLRKNLSSIKGQELKNKLSKLI